jgi:hypothetical protein
MIMERAIDDSSSSTIDDCDELRLAVHLLCTAKFMAKHHVQSSQPLLPGDWLQEREQKHEADFVESHQPAVPDRLKG